MITEDWYKMLGYDKDVDKELVIQENGQLEEPARVDKV